MSEPLPPTLANDPNVQKHLDLHDRVEEREKKRGFLTLLHGTEIQRSIGYKVAVGAATAAMAISQIAGVGNSERGPPDTGAATPIAKNAKEKGTEIEGNGASIKPLDTAEVTRRDEARRIEEGVAEARAELLSRAAEQASTDLDPTRPSLSDKNELRGAPATPGDTRRPGGIDPWD